MQRISLFMALLFVGLVTTGAFAQQTKARKLIGDIQVGEVSSQTPRQVPSLLWGGEAATFYANGGVTTTSNSIFGKLGLSYRITNGDNSIQQARDYITGKSPFIRMTSRMSSLYAEEFNRDERTRPVAILQLTYSLGDHMVAREGVKTLNDLKGLTVCLQEGGPHLGLVDDALKAAGLSWNDVKVKWVKNLTGKDSPSEALRDGSADVACVITPDMIGLCSGLDEVGSGAEGTVKGAHVLTSTTTQSRSIADIYCVRADFYNSNREEVENFVAGYLQACESIVKFRKTYDAGDDAPAYVAVMNQMQKFYGADALPTIEEDVHGLILDAQFARVPGNEIFFKDKNNLAGYAAKQKLGLALAANLGYLNDQTPFAVAEWDYKALSDKIGVKYVKPVYAKGRIKAEVTDFMEDLEDNTIFTFDIYFEPNQTNFPVEQYTSKFKQFCESIAAFGNAAVIIEGNGDPTLALKQFFWAAKAKGLITGSKGNYQFNGQALSLSDTKTIIKVIESTSLSGQTRTNRSGNTEEIPDPRETVAAALTTSQIRANNAKKGIEQFAKKNGYQIDLSTVFPRGVGIANPVNPRPRSLTEAKKNMRVTFRVVKVQAEALNADDFDFED